MANFFFYGCEAAHCPRAHLVLFMTKMAPSRALWFALKELKSGHDYRFSQVEALSLLDSEHIGRLVSNKRSL